MQAVDEFAKAVHECPKVRNSQWTTRFFYYNCYKINLKNISFINYKYNNLVCNY